MRMSICAQSCASVPPAPALISSCASRKSSGPDSSERRRNASISSPSALDLALDLRVHLGVRLDGEHLLELARALHAAARCSSNGSTQLFSALTCCTTACALCWLFQKPGAAMRSSSCLSVSRLASRSKIPPQLGEPLGVLRAAAWRARFPPSSLLSG